MIQRVSTDMQTLTPKFAERLLTYNTFGGQRALSARWVSDLSNVIREDLFTVGHIAVVTYANGGKPTEYVVNGQHQCNAVIAANKSVKIVFDKYVCDTMDDVSLLYRQFDNFKTRSLGNLVTFEMDALGLTWPAKVGQLLVSAAAMKEGIHQSCTKHQKVALLKKYIKEGRWINDLLTVLPAHITQAQVGHLKRFPVVCAMLCAHEKCQRDADVFWKQVRDGENLKRDMPQFVIRDYLKETSFDRGRGASAGKLRSAGEHEITSKCITAWNAFRSGKPTSLKYYRDKEIPKAI